MNLCIKKWGEKISPSVKQWLWFIGLWFGGLFTVGLMSYMIKLAMKV